jgi:hypothetical protein
MNIAFAKIGKSIKFKSNYSPNGGDNEAPSLLRLLANNNPDKKFYLIGKSDFKKLNKEERLSLFIHDNVVDLMRDHKGYSENYVVNKLNELNIKIDYSIFMIGQMSSNNIPNKIKQLKDSTKIVKLLEMTTNYSSHIVDFINSTDVPYIQIVNDPRYTISQAKDILRLPDYTLSQWNGQFIQKCIKSFEDQDMINKQIESTYNEMEKIFLYDKVGPNQNRNRSTNMMIVLNEGKPSRYKLLKDWVLDHIDNVNIYGVWNHENILNDSRYKGSLQIDQIQEKLNDVKYTFIIPIAEGWTTSKYIEMIHAGVIPFLHPTYDSQYNLDLPDILRPKSIEELFNSIEHLNNNDDVYLQLIKDLQDKFCTKDLYDGSKLSSIIINKLFT